MHIDTSRSVMKSSGKLNATSRMCHSITKIHRYLLGSCLLSGNNTQLFKKFKHQFANFRSKVSEK